MEHRCGERRQVILSVRLHGAGQVPATGWLTDISLSGAYVRTLAALPVLSQIALEFADGPLSLTRVEPVTVSGRIVRHGPAGFGVEWEEFASEALGAIVRLGMFNREHIVEPAHVGAQSSRLPSCTTHALANDEHGYPEP